MKESSLISGFKKTKFGIVPKDWPLHTLGEIANVQTGLAKGKKGIKNPISLPYIRVANVQDGYLKLDEIKKITVSKDEIKRFLLQKGDVLFTEGGDFDKLGRGTIWNNEIENCLHQNHIFAVRVDKSKILPTFLNILSSSSYGRRYFMLSSKQSTNLASINSSQLKLYPIPLPPLPEQTAIAHVLELMDKAIQLNEQVIAQKELRKKWLMQQLLTGKRRVKGFGREWKEISLGNLFNRVTRKNTEVNTNVVTISAQRGFVRQTDFFNKTIASDILDNYFLVQKGEFCYNKSYSNGYPWGATKRLNDYEKAVVTTLYICFGIKDENKTDGNFFEQFFEANLLDRGLTQIAHEGGRAHGLLNVTPSDFFSLKITVPEKAEQTAIAQILQAADKELGLLRAKGERLREQKKGVMGVLLTGRKRLEI